MTDTQSPEPDVIMSGRVKWFNKKAGYGFISTEDASGADIFVHHSALQTECELFRYLVEGEYVNFSIKPGETNAVNVTGPQGGKLMCETRHIRQTTYQSRGNTDENKTKQPRKTGGQHRKQVFVSGDIDDGYVWELVRRAPKTIVSDAKRTVRSKGPRISTSS